MAENEIAALVARLTDLLGAPPVAAPAPVRTTPERILLTAEEAAKRLNIGRTLMYHLIGTGEVASVMIGRLRRVPVSAIDEYAQRLVTEQVRPNAA